MTQQEDLETLIERHQELDDRVDEMNHRPYLSPHEQLSLRELKFLRLRLRRTITSIQER